MKDMKLMLSCGVAVIGAIAALAPAAASAQNLVDNGDFESGTLNWLGGEVVTDSPHGGLACMRVVDDDPASSVAAGTAAIVPVTRGTAYRFQVWVRATDPGQRLLVTINQYDAGGSWISGHNYDFDVTAGTDWSSVEYTLRVFDELAAGIRISLRPALWTDSGDLMGTAWFDDVVFEESPIDETPEGAWLVKGGGGVDVWHSSLEQKVRRDAALPDDAPSETAVAIFGARGEVEPLQVVLVPSAAGSLTGAAVSTLVGPSGSSIDASLIAVREVAYVEVTDPTDQASMSGWIPDPLPLLEPPLALAAGVQQPLWVTVSIPADAAAGDYAGTLTLSLAAGPPVQVPVTLHVWDFGVPPEHHLRTAYGMGTGMIDRYHNLGGDGALRDQVISLYLEDFSSHRISPYNPFGDDMYGVSLTTNWPSGLVLVDPDDPAGTNHALRVEDASTTSCVGASAELLMAVTPAASYTLSWRARTEGAHDYLVAATQYDAARGWISGHNLDFVMSGDGTWRSESVVIDGASLDAGAAFVRLTLYARRWTADGADTGVTWFDDVVLREEGGTGNLVTNGDFELTPVESVAAADFVEFDAAARRAFDTLMFDGFVLPLYHFAYGSWEGSQTDVDILGYPWGSPEYEALFTRVLQAVTGHMSEMGWLGRAYTYWYDEPSPPDYALVQQGMDLIARAEPNLKRMLTEQVEPELVGYVDIWSPVLSEYDEAAAHARQAAGEDVWWYVCTGPRAPYPNNFIDHPGIEHRILFWMTWKYGVQGSLYWETTWWTNDNVFTPPGYQDPWVDPRSIYYTGSGETGNWGNGDGRLLYPPRDWADGTPKIEGPTPSIRWELLREGIEDFEYFSLLRELADGIEASGLCPELVAPARALLEVPESIVVTRTQFTQDPALLAARRGEVAEMIEEILRCAGPMEDIEPAEGLEEMVEGVDGEMADGGSDGAADGLDGAGDGEGDGVDQGGNGGSGCGCQVAR